MCFETFDLNQPEKYIGKICLYKEHSWDCNYIEIKVINVSNGFIKYKSCSNEAISITDTTYFEGKRFVISPFHHSVTTSGESTNIEESETPYKTYYTSEGNQK